jgi:hypothetical protein
MHVNYLSAVCAHSRDFPAARGHLRGEHAPIFLRRQAPLGLTADREFKLRVEIAQVAGERELTS